jgi:hypothetical protein
MKVIHFLTLTLCLFLTCLNYVGAQIENFSIGTRPSLITNKLSFIQLSYESQLEDWNEHLSCGIHSRLFLDYFSGVSFDFYGRWYFKPKVSEINGWYLQPKIGYNVSRVNFDSDIPKDKSRFLTYGGGLALGRKFLIKELITLDAYMGYNYVSKPGYKVNIDLIDKTKTDQQDLDDAWYATFGFPLEFKVTFGFIID